MAIILPVLLLVLTGILQFGVLLSAQIGLVNGVRDGARYGSVCNVRYVVPAATTNGAQVSNYLISPTTPVGILPAREPPRPPPHRPDPAVPERAAATGEIESQLRRGLREAAALVQQHHADRGRILLERARLVADLPRLKAALATADPPTIDPLARDYAGESEGGRLALTDSRGKRLAVLGDASLENTGVEGALSGMETASVQAGSAALFEVVTVPVTMAEPLEVLGSLTLGTALDDAMAARFKALTGSDVALAYRGSVRASTMPRSSDALLEPVLRSEGVVSLRLGANEYVAVHEPLGAGGDAPGARPSLARREPALRAARCTRCSPSPPWLRWRAVAVLLGYALARTVTRPLAAVTGAMSEGRRDR